MRVQGQEAGETRLSAPPHHGRRRRTLLAVAGVAALSVAAPAVPAAAATGVTDNIAFVSNPPAPGKTGTGRYRINVMNIAGVGVTLNANPGGAYDDVDPAWSPDGRRIAFASDRGGNYDIYVMNADGSGVRRVTTEPRDDRYPAWSPDGSRLAYRGYAAPTGGSQIFTMHPDGTGAAPIAHTFGGDQPSWAPDGHRIAFTDTDATPGPALEVVNTATGAISPLTSGADDRYPAWSHDGSRITFRRRDPSGLGREVWMVPAGGGTPLNLSGALGAPARAASWAPDSRRVTFVSYRDADHNQEIWLGSVDGSTPARQLTFTTWNNEEPRWVQLPIAASPVPPATGPTSGGGGGTVGGGVAPGTHKAALSLSLRVPRQRLGKRKSVRALVRCNQRCSVLVSGTVRRSAHSKKVIRLRRVHRTLAARRWVHVKVPLGAKALRVVRTSLRHHRRVRVTLNASARTSAGAFTPSATKRITLRK